jgi:hypothetical protein
MVAFLTQLLFAIRSRFARHLARQDETAIREA